MTAPTWCIRCAWALLGRNAVGEACGDDDERRNDGGDRVKQRRVLRDADDVLVLREVRAVHDHAAARDGEGEERLSHRPDQIIGSLSASQRGVNMKR